MEHEKEMKAFLSNEVDLNETRRDRLTKGVQAVTDALSDLTCYEKYEMQGSFALDTIIKPVDDNDEYDADITLMMEHDPVTYPSPKSYIEGVFEHLKENGTYKEKVFRKTRCVRINYEGDCHLDLVPCVKRYGELWICNWETNDWEITDGTGYREWFMQQNSLTASNLRKAIQLIKFLRDHKNTFTAPSIILTTLLGREVYNNDTSETYNTIAGTLRILSKRVGEFLENNPDIPVIANPVLDSETFSSPTDERHWNKTQYKNFRKQFLSLAERIDKAVEETDPEESIKKWQALFGNKFASGHTRNNNSVQTLLVPSPTFSTKVSPRKPYSVASINSSLDQYSPGSRVIYDDQAIRDAKNIFPKLEYDNHSQIIRGEISFAGYYESDQKGSTDIEIGGIGALPHRRLLLNFIEDTFDIQIDLATKETNKFTHLPTIRETKGRIISILQKLNCSLADLHIFDDHSFCLGIQNSPNTKISIAIFLQKWVIPFLYRLSYTEKFGLKAAQNNLWSEYSHGQTGIEEYNSEVNRKNPRNSPCPCGSGKKYKHCHINDLPFDS